MGEEGQLRTAYGSGVVLLLRDDQTRPSFQLVEMDADGAVMHPEARNSAFDRERAAGGGDLAIDGKSRLLAEGLTDL